MRYTQAEQKAEQPGMQINMFTDQHADLEHSHTCWTSRQVKTCSGYPDLVLAVRH